VLGLPVYHPLFKDADKRLDTLKVAFDRFAGKYRRPTGFERHCLDLSPFSPTFVPDIKPLGRAATADDVKAGLAVFHLDGKGKPADLKLPAVAGLKKEEKNERAGKVVIVQAEVSPDGAVTYGILSSDGIRTVAASELTEIKTLDQLRKEQEEAEKEREKAKDKDVKKKD
jgi:hypothetical protein